MAILELPRNIEKWQIAVIVILVLIIWRGYYVSSTKVNAPVVGATAGFLGSWKGALRFMTNANLILREGVRKYGSEGITFKVPTPTRWIVFVTDPKLITEIRESPKLSFTAAADERIAVEYFGDPKLNVNPYHLDIISKKLTQRLTVVLPDVLEEITMAFEEYTNIGSEWTLVNNYNVMLNCVARTTNRLFVGIPLCRKQDYLDELVDYAQRVGFAAMLLEFFPRILKPMVAPLILNKNKPLRKMLEHVGPIFSYRREKLQQLGADWTDRPNDAVQWIVESAPPESSLKDMCFRLLFLNIAAVHTSTIAITHVLLDLAAYPEYQEPLRQEVESVLREFGGWSKQALTKMKKLDSVLRESQRLNGAAIATILHKATAPCTLSDGTYLPKGTWVSAPSSAIHDSELYYEDPLKFDGFRFSRMREQPGSEAKWQLVNTGTTFLSFGHGKHACPGRFFAANELKILLAYIICNYEFKTVNGNRPANVFYLDACIPDMSPQLMFKERKGRMHSLVNQRM